MPFGICALGVLCSLLPPSFLPRGATTNQDSQGPREEQCARSLSIVLDSGLCHIPNLYPSRDPPNSSHCPLRSASTATIISVTTVFHLQQPFDNFLCGLILFTFHTQAGRLKCRSDPSTPLPRASYGSYIKEKVFSVVDDQA